MKRFLVVVLVAGGCATAKEAAIPPVQTITVQKTVMVEVRPADLWDCAQARQEEGAQKLCASHNEFEQIRYERDLLLAEKKSKKAEPPPAPPPKEEKRRRRRVGPVMLAMTFPGGCEDGFTPVNLPMRQVAPLSPLQGMRLTYLQLGDPTRRATHAVAQYRVPGSSMVWMAAAPLHQDLFVPVRSGEHVKVAFEECDDRGCRTVLIKEYTRTSRSMTELGANGGFQRCARSY